jgi:glycosyltransferase involved in cell wall biosynthesis
MNRILIVYGELHHGGLQTLIVRLANYLAANGRAVAVCVPGGELAALIDSAADLLLWTDRKDAAGKAADWIASSDEPVTMISFDPIAAALGLAIEARNAGRVPLVHLSGVYHPRSFFMTGERRDRMLLNRLVAKAVGDPFIFFMNAECRDGHERRWRVPLKSSAIIPIPIEKRSAAWRPSGSGELRIVSVGRLVDFKTYNLTAPEIVRECLDQGTSVRWDIYGYGPLDQPIAEAIAAHRVADAVHIKGSLAYSDFTDAVASYDLFIGMGTAALEAAMLGVPTIVATESEPRRCYGFVHQLPFGNVGERQSFEPPFDLGELIRGFAAADKAEREAISLRGREAALRYDLASCIEAFDRLAADRPDPPSMAFKRAVSALYEGATASRVAEAARRIRDFVRG